MRSSVRNILVPAFVVAVGAAMLLHHLQTSKSNELRFASEARAAQLRADQGDANAEYELGRLYLLGRGVPQDYKQANSWFQKAAGQDLAKAEVAIGDLYCDGNGVDQSYTDALRWYRKAANQGYPMAEQAMGKMSFYGYGVPQSYLGAFSWYKKSADQGTAKSQFDIGYLYRHGLGVAQDNEESDRWFRMSASQGHEDAQRALGLRFSPLPQWEMISQYVLLAVCFILMSGYVSQQHLRRNQDARNLVLGGALGLLSIGMYLFAHSTYGLFPSAAVANVFRAATFFLGGVAVASLTTAIWPRAEKSLLMLSGLMAALAALSLYVMPRSDAIDLAAIASRLFILVSGPAGVAIFSVLHLRRRVNGPERETPPDHNEPSHAV